MKALVVRQPWANLIRVGVKTIETRKWQTRYRGPLLIVAGKTVDREAAEMPGLWSRVGVKPQGAIVAAVNLKDVRSMVATDAAKAWCPVYPGAFSWVIDTIHSFDPPVSARGALGLFDIECPHPIWRDNLIAVDGQCHTPVCAVCGQTRAF